MPNGGMYAPPAPYGSSESPRALSFRAQRGISLWKADPARLLPHFVRVRLRLLGTAAGRRWENPIDTASGMGQPFWIQPQGRSRRL